MDGLTERHTVTLLNGSFEFDDVDPGTYLLDMGIDPAYDCTSNNRPVRLPAAVREGAVHIVTMGDSVSVTGSDVPHPERLARHLSRIVPTTLDNLAVDGSTTWEWLPGGEKGYFEDRLLPVLADADVLTMTLGANDLYAYISDGPPYDPVEIIERLLEHPEYLTEFIPNVLTTIEEIRRRNPVCDIVYVVYWNPVNSEFMKGIMGDLQPLASQIVKTGIGYLRSVIAKIDGIVLVDVFESLGDTMIDPYLFDEAHPNDLGHQMYADVLFRSIGGVVLEPDSAENRLFGFYAPDLIP